MPANLGTLLVKGGHDAHGVLDEGLGGSDKAPPGQLILAASTNSLIVVINNPTAVSAAP